MARGRIFFSGTSLDSASDPDDTALVAAPGAGQTIYVKWLAVTVYTVQASSIVVIENGAGGGRLLHKSSATAGTTVWEFPGDGLKLSANTALNATIEGATGVVATASGEVCVR